MPASDSKCNSLIPTAESQLFQTLTCTTVRIFIFHRKFLGILSFLWTVVLAHHSSQLAWDISIATPGISTKTLFQPQTPSYHCRHWHWMPSLESQSGNMCPAYRGHSFCVIRSLSESLWQDCLDLELLRPGGSFNSHTQSLSPQGINTQPGWLAQDKKQG